MATFRIRIVNEDFEASNMVDAPDYEAARVEALKGALQIGTDEVCSGKRFFGAEIIVSDEKEQSERMMVSIGTSPLQ